MYRKVIYLESTDKCLDFKAPFQKEYSGVFSIDMCLLNSNTAYDRIQRNFSENFCSLTGDAIVPINCLMGV